MLYKPDDLGGFGISKGAWGIIAMCAAREMIESEDVSGRCTLALYDHNLGRWPKRRLVIALQLLGFSSLLSSLAFSSPLSFVSCCWST